MQTLGRLAGYEAYESLEDELNQADVFLWFFAHFSG
jgi:hypothetical protein